MTNDNNTVQPPYYICQDYSVLAGPYDINCQYQKQMLNNVINDMKRGNIDYRLTTEITNVPNSKGDLVEVKKVIVERRGMILYKA